MGKIIGKVIATEKNPSTIDDFYFWTKQNLILNPFDVVKVSHLQNTVTYGVIEEISHITDTANFLSDYVSNDFGNVETVENTHRIGMNYVKAKVINNTGNIYIPLINNTKVEFADEEEVAEALGLKNVKNPVTCGYLEMYNGDEDKITLPVKMDSRFLIGPEGAHLNISGISGLAAKTSYAMFLLKAIQDKCLREDGQDDDVAFVLFNVKGKDLLALDEHNEFESEAEKKLTFEMYKKLGMSTEPFKNVQYYYPYATNKIGNTYLHREAYDNQRKFNKAHLYKFSYEEDKDNLDLMFASMDDPQQTMDSIINYIINNQGGFGGLDGWDDFLEEVQRLTRAGAGGEKDITVNSWRKFNRIIRKSIYNNEIFDSVNDNGEEVRIGEALKHIKKDEVHVIDIAKLNEDMQGFVFGDAIRTIYDLQLGQFSEDKDVNPPKKIIIFIDEMNKYASTDTPKSSPILRQILDIAERGRSLGIILFSAEQFRSAIHSRVTGNCSTHAYGRTNAIEIAKPDYKFVPQVYKNMMTRLKQGEYIIQNPIFRSLLNIKFPKPIYKQYKQ
ncbi:ATP-binding protein [[Ruminococcus] gnavus]|uniref:ATP-binding protein n=1 Tax=Mediterraneibacter gnavus TaxID=33038 RepID=UPI001F1B2A72|nr:ATP-binding protein [Mediterraneibacter gnavus]MCF2693362.1 ATP-binding protein [Mediterraneibacter gnavus]